jgi:hypothetical protein
MEDHNHAYLENHLETEAIFLRPHSQVRHRRMQGPDRAIVTGASRVGEYVPRFWVFLNRLGTVGANQPVFTTAMAMVSSATKRGMPVVNCW